MTWDVLLAWLEAPQLTNKRGRSTAGPSHYRDFVFDSSRAFFGEVDPVRRQKNAATQSERDNSMAMEAALASPKACVHGLVTFRGSE